MLLYSHHISSYHFYLTTIDTQQQTQHQKTSQCNNMNHKEITLNDKK